MYVIVKLQVGNLCYYPRPRRSRGVITKISFECKWGLTGFYPMLLSALIDMIQNYNRYYNVCGFQYTLKADDDSTGV